MWGGGGKCLSVCTALLFSTTAGVQALHAHSHHPKGQAGGLLNS